MGAAQSTTRIAASVSGMSRTMTVRCGSSGYDQNTQDGVSKRVSTPTPSVRCPFVSETHAVSRYGHSSQLSRPPGTSGSASCGRPESVTGASSAVGAGAATSSVVSSVGVQPTSKTVRRAAGRTLGRLRRMETSLDPRPDIEKFGRTRAPDEDALIDGVHILTTILLIATLVSSVNLPFGEAALNLLLGSGFAVLYFYGTALQPGWREGTSLAWLLSLTMLWVLAMLMSPVGIYLVFSLFFLYLRVMDDVRGVVAVVAATAASILTQVPAGLTVGGVMGPAVSAAVVLAIHYAFRTLVRINREREELITQLMDTRLQLAETERAAGVTEERQRLAHEIHDTVAQGLSSIQMLLHSAERDLQRLGLSEEELAGPTRFIDLARTTAKDNLGEARAMIAALQPASLSETSLESALERMAAGFAAAGDLRIEVGVEGTERQLPMKTEAALLRIAQGAVGNVAKHAEASRCRVTVTYEADEVRLDVVDNGRGFDPAAVAEQPAGLGHVGLDAMRRRAAEQGGAVEVESTPGYGTAVSVAIPVPADAGAAATLEPETPTEEGV